MKKIPFKKMIILGATGFLGSRLQKQLEWKGAEVHGFGSATLNMLKPESFQVLDPLMDSETVLLIPAALTPEKGATLDVLQNGLTMTLNTARYLENRTAGLCVNISSDAVYPMEYNPITETTPVDPSNFYALAKYSAERIYTRMSETKNIPLLNLRLTALYGPGDTHGSYGPNGFIKSILKDKTLKIFGLGEEKRDHLHVDDAVQLICELVREQAEGTFNLASGQSVSFMEIVEILKKSVSTPFEVIHAPRKSQITHRHFDITKLFKTLPSYTTTSIEKGLAQTAKAIGLEPS